MLTLSGAPAISDFRLAKLLATIRDRVGHVTRLDSRYLHFVDVERPLDRGRAAGPRVVAALRAAGPGDDARRPAGAGGAALRHGLAVVEQGHRHRARLRPHRSAPHRAWRRLLRAGGPAAVAGGMVGGRRRAARPHDRERAARGWRGRGAVRARRAAAAGDGAAAGRGHCGARARQRDAGPGAVRTTRSPTSTRRSASWAATRRTSS